MSKSGFFERLRIIGAVAGPVSGLEEGEQVRVQPVLVGVR
jgi:hypothetical protein